PSTSARLFGSSCRFRSPSSSARRKNSPPDARSVPRCSDARGAHTAFTPDAARSQPSGSDAGIVASERNPKRGVLPFRIWRGLAGRPSVALIPLGLMLTGGALLIRSEVVPSSAGGNKSAGAPLSAVVLEHESGSGGCGVVPGRHSGGNTAASGSGSGSGSTQGSGVTAPATDTTSSSPSAGSSARHGFTAAGRGATGPQGQRGAGGTPGVDDAGGAA